MVHGTTKVMDVVLVWTPGRDCKDTVSGHKIHLCHKKGAQMAAWGTLCSLEEEQEVGKVRTHLSGMRPLPAWGSGACPPPCSRCSKQSLECPATCCDLGKWFVGITHGFTDIFLGTVRTQQFQEDWARQPWGKVTVPGCRGPCGAVLVIRHPGEPVGETFLGDPHPGFEVPQLQAASPGHPVCPRPGPT